MFGKIRILKLLTTLPDKLSVVVVVRVVLVALFTFFHFYVLYLSIILTLFRHQFQFFANFQLQETFHCNKDLFYLHLAKLMFFVEVAMPNSIQQRF